MEDQKIIELYFDRAESAISETAGKYGRFCMTVAKNILGNEHDAEECVDDAYFALWNRIPPERPKSLRSYLGKIVRNISLDRLDYNTASCRNADILDIFDEIAELISDTSAAEPFSEESEKMQAINRFLERERPMARKIFVRRYWYCDSIRAIAARYELGESAVKSVLSRMRRRLIRYWEREGFGNER